MINVLLASLIAASQGFLLEKISDVGRGLYHVPRDAVRGLITLKKDIAKGGRNVINDIPIGFSKDVGQGLFHLGKDVTSGVTAFAKDTLKGTKHVAEDIVDGKLRIINYMRNLLRGKTTTEDPWTPRTTVDTWTPRTTEDPWTNEELIINDLTSEDEDSTEIPETTEDPWIPGATEAQSQCRTIRTPVNSKGNCSLENDNTYTCTVCS